MRLTSLAGKHRRCFRGRPSPAIRSTQEVIGPCEGAAGFTRGRDPDAHGERNAVTQHGEPHIFADASQADRIAELGGGADRTIVDDAGKTPADVAREQGNAETLRVIEGA